MATANFCESPGRTRVWIVDQRVNGKRRKVDIGNYDPKGGKAIVYHLVTLRLTTAGFDGLNSGHCRGMPFVTSTRTTLILPKFPARSAIGEYVPPGP